MLRIIVVVIAFFILISIGPALLKQYLPHGPFAWAINAGKATGDDAVAANVKCLKDTAKRLGLETQAQAACGTKTGVGYIDCMKNFFLTEDALAKVGNTDVAAACAGTSTQSTIDSAAENFAWAKFCSKLPRWIPAFVKTWIQCPGSH
jgi:hypothetical protein